MTAINIFFKTSLLLFSLCLAIPTFAQTEAWKEEMEKTIKLKEELRKAVADTVTLTKMREQYKSQLSDIELQIASTDAQISNIQKSTDSKYLAAFSKQVDSLQKVSIEIDSTKQVISAELADLKKQLSELQEDLTNMGVYNNIKNDKILDGNLLILAKSYSDITEDEMQKISHSVDVFAYRKDFEEYKKRVATAEQNCALCRRAQSALTEKFDPAEISNVRDELAKLLSIETDNIAIGQFKLTEAQFSLLDSLDIKLSRFKNGVKELKALVNAVNTNEEVEKCRTNGDKEACIAAISSIILPTNDNTKKVYERYFNLIPFLKKLLEEYWNELKENPLTYPGPIASQIENL